MTVGSRKRGSPSEPRAFGFVAVPVVAVVCCAGWPLIAAALGGVALGVAVGVGAAIAGLVGGTVIALGRRRRGCDEPRLGPPEDVA